MTTDILPNRTNGDVSLLPIRIVEDNSEFANLLDATRFGHLQRVASLFANSQLVPAHFQGNVPNCFIAMQMAMRMGVDPFMFMQHCYIVYGRPGIEAKLTIALINTSGLFTDSIDYEIVGDDPHGKDYKVRAFATRKSSGRVIYGPWIDWKLVDAEGWSKKNGNKWATMPGIMFQYRAATLFGRLHCPERMMGMQTVEELHDIGPQDVQVIDRSTSVKDRLVGAAKASATVRPVPAPADSPITAKAAATESAPTQSEPEKPQGIEPPKDVPADVDPETGEVKQLAPSSMDLSTHAKLVDALNEAGMVLDVTPSGVVKWWQDYSLPKGALGPAANRKSPEWRAECLAAFKAAHPAKATA